METIALLLALLAFLSLIGSVIGLINPKLLKQQSRIKAFLSYLGGAFVFLIIAGVITPSEENEKSHSQILQTDIQADENTKKQIQPHTICVIIEIKPKLAEGKLNIEGISNLPDQMTLMIHLSRGKNYSAACKVKIMDGRFSSGSFSHKGEPLRNGQYEIEISSPLCQCQDQSVQNIIGSRGENLAGPLVKRNSDSFRDDKFIEFKTIYIIKTSVEAENDIPSLSKELSSFQSHYNKLLTAIEKDKVDGVWSAQWNRKLDNLRSNFSNEFGSNINQYKEECPQAFLNISVAAGYMYNVWSEYYSLASGRGSKRVFDDMRSYVKEHFDEAKTALNECQRESALVRQ